MCVLLQCVLHVCTAVCAACVIHVCAALHVCAADRLEEYLRVGALELVLVAGYFVNRAIAVNLHLPYDGVKLWRAADIAGEAPHTHARADAHTSEAVARGGYCR